MLRIFTTRVAYGGSDRLDITRGGAENNERAGQPHGLGAILAPSRELLNWGRSHFAAELNPVTCAAMFPEYAERYRAEMRASYRRDPGSWGSVLRKEAVVLCCFCPFPAWCHRTVAAELLVKAARGQAVYCGELWEDGGLGALTLHPEWAWAVAWLKKTHENRDWANHAVVGRWLAIHGGKSVGGKVITKKDGSFSDGHWEALADMVSTAKNANIREYPDGAITPQRMIDEGRGIVALARITGCVEQSDSKWFFGPYGFELSDVVRLDKPVPCNGAQMFWSVKKTPELLAAVRAALPESAPLALEWYLDHALHPPA